MTLGLKRGTVALVPHETAWETEAARTIGELKALLGDAAADLRHVGSTSIPSIKAKPIVDIAVAAQDLSAVRAREEALLAAGYYFRPTDLPEQLLIARGSFYEGTGDLQTHFIHVVKKDGQDWRDYLNFRAYLIAFPAAAKEYEALKERLARECPVDAGRAHYLAGKQEFIRRTLRKATVWSFLGKRAHIVIDRPVGYVHKKESYTLTYPLNYGYIPGVFGGDGEELDVYLLGETAPLREADCVVIGAVHRRDDEEDKLIAAPPGTAFTKAETEAAVRFQERWYDSDVIAAADADRFEALYGAAPPETAV